MKISLEKVRKIASLLERETHLYSRLLSIAEEIQTIMIKNNVEALSQKVASEDVIFTQAEKLRQERTDIMLSVKEELGLSDDEYGFGRMMEFLDENDAKELKELRDNLLDSINKLDSVNRNNHELVNYSLNLNAKFMNLLVNLGQDNAVYESSGKLDEKKQKSKVRLLDKRI